MPNPVPEQALYPYLVFRNAAEAIAFYQRAFGATETSRTAMPDGKIGHAELLIGTGKLMLSDEWPEHGALSAEHYGGSPIGLHLYVPDVDAFFARAMHEGVTVLKPVADQFYGDRSGTVRDPFGYKWTFSTHTEDVSPEEISRRLESLFARQP